MEVRKELSTSTEVEGETTEEKMVRHTKWEANQATHEDCKCSQITMSLEVSDFYVYM